MKLLGRRGKNLPSVITPEEKEELRQAQLRKQRVDEGVNHVLTQLFAQAERVALSNIRHPPRATKR